MRGIILILTLSIGGVSLIVLVSTVTIIWKVTYMPPGLSVRHDRVDRDRAKFSSVIVKSITQALINQY